jgi:hypothetical protein
MPDSDQCALGRDGRLLDADQITWYNDQDDEAALPTAGSQHTVSLSVRALHPLPCLGILCDNFLGLLEALLPSTYT